MQAITFPLLCGHLSIDLVNTEVVRRGQRIDLLPTEIEMNGWLNAVQAQIPFLTDVQVDVQQQLPVIRKSLLHLRSKLRKQFEAVTAQQPISPAFIDYLETLIEQAPFTYKLKNGQLMLHPLGNIAEKLQAIIAFDALALIASGQLQQLKRCANNDCVLLFIDESGRRKWCSMKICGNRNKVAKFQQRES